MVQRFCLVSLTISNRKTSYRSLKQTAGSTSCQWTTILVVFRHILCEIIYPDDERRRSVTEQDIYLAIQAEIQEMHGDYGTAATRKMPPLQGSEINNISLYI